MVKTKSISAPRGYHFMKKGSGYTLMKNPTGGFKPHKGASLKAIFKIQKVHKRLKENPQKRKRLYPLTLRYMHVLRQRLNVSLMFTQVPMLMAG